ncbi:hypothetical protein PHYBLDRAFT_72390 [Phycomyces blakesleeanus NRRL 1555(-)]|uniref:Uncharacterized protein n=1 Tax=Phycomyces blakesleeanus (strain ATCC 8743b / DSM 1359 / FGSC 10004 / NBRC 33097 / NRRL 1555) TaxID=763407 RepID=A0A162W9Q0_PHYB8|nr:hypothetical protein PHYBLDRAFT_72390 [Phycomyces blakesleeanus NRRL 1555(-)]OAD65695.1 hypothetical protein PHYBLDRAFT_72390 [Phycomyces blakesleeanus NRRL 1555(-)]|eukprot:XP_018283735.1 hypothetical protein PHYBLDRAFT_72390 [Phycomyces blakesleeanus NRRL 1555(-)]
MRIDKILFILKRLQKWSSRNGIWLRCLLRLIVMRALFSLSTPNVEEHKNHSVIDRELLAFLMINVNSDIMWIDIFTKHSRDKLVNDSNGVVKTMLITAISNHIFAGEEKRY